MLMIDTYETLRSILDSHAYSVTGLARLLQPAGLEGLLQGLTLPPATGAPHLSVSFA